MAVKRPLLVCVDDSSAITNVLQTTPLSMFIRHQITLNRIMECCKGV